MLSFVALAALATPVHGEDDFPLVGTYTENQACKTDATRPCFIDVLIEGAARPLLLQSLGRAGDLIDDDTLIVHLEDA